MAEPESTAETAAPEAEPGGVTQEERNWALTAHLGPLVAGLLTGGILAFLVPLVIFLVKREESEFVADQSKESLNFQITVFLAFLLSIPLMLILVGVLLAILIYLAEVVFCIVAAIQAYDGKRYRYPFAVRLVS